MSGTGEYNTGNGNQPAVFLRCKVPGIHLTTDGEIDMNKPTKEVYEAIREIQKKSMTCGDMAEILNRSVNSEDDLSDGQKHLITSMGNMFAIGDELDVICEAFGISPSTMYHESFEEAKLSKTEDDEEPEETETALAEALPVFENNIPKAKRLALAGIASRHIRLLLCSIGENDNDTVCEYVGHTLTKIEEELDQIDCMLGANNYAAEEAEVTA